MSKLAIDGGSPVRSTPLPYGKQLIDRDDIAQVMSTLSSPWLTCGPAVADFERAFASAVGAKHAVAVSSGTAALHTALASIDLMPDDEVIVPAVTFVASANAAVYLGAIPRFADIEEDTLLIDPDCIGKLISERTRAIVAVDYAGQPCDYRRISELSATSNVRVIADACHALGASRGGMPVGTLADLNTFSFHPVKHITTAEGGMITTEDESRARRMRAFRSHGITSDFREREARGTWHYDMTELGYNYRLSDLQCALGLSQLAKLERWVERRNQLAQRYDLLLREIPAVLPLRRHSDVRHAYHLYVVRCDPTQMTASRDQVLAALRAEGIMANVHYKPVYLHSFYVQKFGSQRGSCPKAEKVAETIISLPLWPGMADDDVESVVEALRKVTAAYKR